MGLLHAIVVGLLVGGLYWGFRSMGWFENRSKVQQALIFLPTIFVVVFILNLIWPSA
jgi:hypothetical protein